jgi:hypothetical protein
MKLTYELIYSLLKKELAALREYLEENQKKGFIRSLIINANYLILFVLKLRRKLRLCVDYRRLNEIIIKN